MNFVIGVYTIQIIKEGSQMNLAYDMRRRANEAPDRIGLIFEDGSEYTFKEID